MAAVNRLSIVEARSDAFLMSRLSKRPFRRWQKGEFGELEHMSVALRLSDQNRLAGAGNRVRNFRSRRLGSVRERLRFSSVYSAGHAIPLSRGHMWVLGAPLLPRAPPAASRPPGGRTRRGPGRASRD